MIDTNIQEEMKIFKNELKNYTLYKKRVKSLDELINICYDMLSGVKAIRYDKEPTHTPPNKDREYEIREEISHHERNKARTQAKLDDIDKILNLIETDTRELIIDVYANNIPMEEFAKVRYISSVGLLYQVNKAIKEAIIKSK